ncbi:MAG: hypothetical protein K8T26_19535 [Lentisphaerae bacterium]|nr:hypothetical protein [Lentisphaerota bacterium]
MSHDGQGPDGLPVSAGQRERQRAQLARWLAEWQVDQAMGASPWEAGPRPPGIVREWGGAGGGGWGGAGLVADLAAEPAPDVGQIRLLAPAAMSSSQVRPLYVAILARDAAGACEVAPFSRFAEPAFAGEWLTGRAALPLRVLCLWNTRALDATILATSWLVDALSLEELADAQAVRTHLTEGRTLPSALAARVGPPLFHPDDPRHAYRYRETLLMDGIGRAGGTSYERDAGPNDLRRAAEDREPFGTPPPPDKPS